MWMDTGNLQGGVKCQVMTEPDLKARGQEQDRAKVPVVRDQAAAEVAGKVAAAVAAGAIEVEEVLARMLSTVRIVR